MSIHNTELDSINNICSLVKEIIELASELEYDYPEASYKEFTKVVFKNADLIVAKANTIRNKAQRMEDRLRDYKTTIESLGFKRVKPKRKEK